jgi:hypothetical protein
MNLVIPGQLWTCNDAHDRTTRQWFTVLAVDVGRGVVIVRYAKTAAEGARQRGGTKSLKNLRLGLRGSRLEVDADGKAPTTRKPSLGALSDTTLEKTTASDHRRLIAPKWMTADEKRRWLAENGVRR